MAHFFFYKGGPFTFFANGLSFISRLVCSGGGIETKLLRAGERLGAGGLRVRLGLCKEVICTLPH